LSFLTFLSLPSVPPPFEQRFLLHRSSTCTVFVFFSKINPKPLRKLCDIDATLLVYSVLMMIADLVSFVVHFFIVSNTNNSSGRHSRFTADCKNG
jgi:hypothetical protein